MTFEEYWYHGTHLHRVAGWLPVQSGVMESKGLRTRRENQT